MSDEPQTDTVDVPEISVKEAVANAMSFAQAVFPEQLVSLALEEVERTADRRFWLITIGFDRPRSSYPTNTQPFRGLASGTSYSPNRTYKVVKVDAHTGDIESVKIRDVATVP